MAKTYKPEERLQVAIKLMLDALAPPSILYFHPAQEAIRSAATWGYQLEMGFVKGVSDWIIMGLVEGGCQMIAVELKANRNKITPDQTLFAKWCERAGIAWWEVRTVRVFGNIMVASRIFDQTSFDKWMKYKLPLLAAQLNMPDEQIK